MILVNYLDNIIPIIIPKFQTLVTSITGKLLYVSCKKHSYEIINEIDKWRMRDNVTIVVYMVTLVFHSNEETYRQYRLKTIMINFLRNKIRNVDKMMEIARCSIFRTKYLKIE